MANMNLVTGYYGENHVTSDDAGACNAAIFGTGQYVMDIGGKFAANAVTNNKVTISDGVLMMQGRQARIEPGTTVDLTIDNGATGYNRNDLIVARYTKNASSGVEQVELVVIKGTASTGTASDPTYTNGDMLNDGAILNDMPLYRIPISGINVQPLVQLFTLAQGAMGHAGDTSNPHKVTAAQVGAKAKGAIESIETGGTGAKTAEEARANLGITPANIGAKVKSAIESIETGGTGAKTAEGALSNLGAAASDHKHKLDDLSNVHISSGTPSTLTDGDWYLVKDS